MKEFVEKLIEKLYENVKSSSCPAESCWEHSNKDCDKCSLKKIMISDVIEIVNQLAKEHNNGWIPCSERLPEIESNTSDTVLVCTIDGFQHMAFWCDDGKWRYCESGMIKNPMEWTVIIAWMPLPAPYQKGSE